MKKFIGVGYGALSDSELLSLSYEGPIFKGLDDVGLGPLRAGVKERAQLKEWEAKAEVLAQKGAYIRPSGRNRGTMQQGASGISCDGS